MTAEWPEIDPARAVRGIVPLSEEDLAEEKLLRQRIVGSCAACNGAAPSGCGCLDEFVVAVQYRRAGIPQVYWRLTMQDWYGDPEAGDHVRAYLHNIHAFARDGIGFQIHSDEQFGGTGGTGKTFLLTMALKHAVLSGYTAYLYPVVQLLDDIMWGFDDRGFARRLAVRFENVEFLALDDLGREFRGRDDKHREMVTTRLAALVHRRVQKNLVTLGTTSLSPKQFKDHYDDRLFSLVTSRMRAITLAGGDARAAPGLGAVARWNRITGGEEGAGDGGRQG